MTKAARNRQISESYLNGSTIRELAAEHGLSYQRTYEILVRAGTPRRPCGPSVPDTHAIVVAVLAEGTPPAAARQLGCSAPTVRKYARQAGLSLKSNAPPSCRIDDPGVVIDLRRQGLTFGQIADRIGVTRSAVAGCLHRRSTVASPRV